MSAAAGERATSAVAPLSDGLWVAAVGLAARLAVVVWAAGRFPPAEDGHFYHVVATRIASGEGYTWLWPDGAVTYAAHYPVGYPALVGAVYALVGPRPSAAMVLAALLGSVAVLAVHRVGAHELGRRGALVAALLVAVHPGLVFYTAALMTEGVVASMLSLALWATVVARRGGGRPLAVGVVGLAMGACAMLRPQTLLLAPVLGALTLGSDRARVAVLVRAVAVSVLAVALCLPWTVRNCARMDACAFVSANAGWNLLIGASPAGEGGWAPLEAVGVPAACREVFGEASKDHCFRSAALARIASDPVAWLRLVPAKLSATFDYGGAPGWYLHASSPRDFDNRAKVVLGGVETLFHRLVLGAGLLGLVRLSGRRRRASRAVAWVSGALLLTRAAWVSHLGLCVLAGLCGRDMLRRPIPVLAVSMVGVTALTHAVFFGAGRYAMSGYPLLCLLAALAFDTKRPSGDTAARGTRHGADRN